MRVYLCEGCHGIKPLIIMCVWNSGLVEFGSTQAELDLEVNVFKIVIDRCCYELRSDYGDPWATVD